MKAFKKMGEILDFHQLRHLRQSITFLRNGGKYFPHPELFPPFYINIMGVKRGKRGNILLYS
jgi:hypothetical protein